MLGAGLAAKKACELGLEFEAFLGWIFLATKLQRIANVFCVQLFGDRHARILTERLK